MRGTLRAGTARLLPCVLLAAAAACTINPVTGDRELALVSAADEIAIGTQQYGPSQQMQGGVYRIDPALTAYVQSVGERVAAVSDRALPYEFVVLNNSVPNAWALPGGKIAVNRGLLTELQSEAELAAVLGHEIVHAAARHGAQAMQRGMLLQVAVLASAVAAERSNYSQLAVGAASLGAQLVNLRYGRAAELESDLYGMRYMSAAGYDPQAAVSLQETFVRLSEGRGEEGWVAGLFASHPPSSERVERNRETAASLPAGGELGRERYAEATRLLRQREPAYDLYDQGRRALAENRLDEARRAAAEAVRLVPEEAQFHALLGDVELAERRYEAAIGHYRDAIARDDTFFYYPLRKGLAHQAAGQWDASQADLEASLALLPTADAHYGLGRLAERRGDRARALEHYMAAAQSSSETGQAARDAAVRLDLPQNPGGYLTVRTGLDSGGQLLVEVANPTGVAVTDVAIAIRYVDAQGALRQTVRQLAGTLPPNGSARAATGLGPFTRPDAYEVTIAAARLAE
ncbi:MAG TPA: M48 family metalloprotease [Gammaproteobacteria bacterium]